MANNFNNREDCFEMDKDQMDDEMYRAIDEMEKEDEEEYNAIDDYLDK